MSTLVRRVTINDRIEKAEKELFICKNIFLKENNIMKIFCIAFYLKVLFFQIHVLVVPDVAYCEK